MKNLKHRNVIRDMKEKILSLALDYDNILNGPDLADEEERKYELPDGTIIDVEHSIRYPCTEIMFNPSLINKSHMSLQDMVQDSFEKCDPDLRADLYKNIVLSGGNTLLKGFKDRLEIELDDRFPKDISRSDINYITEGNRRFAAWIGGSMIGSLSVF
mmetsp:Transcript_3953/g.3368  ORF Transcript_3953/g.3368 Transcript_3953/m.3368 type:complete len:158 (-) Transcript_3953:166-639(-)